MRSFRVWQWVLLGGFTILPLAASHAAIERMQAGGKKNHQYISYGTISGGAAGGRSYTLLDVRRILSPKDKVERLILDLGNERGKPLINHISYFQVSVEDKNPRVVIDLSQMLASGVDQKKLEKTLAKSPYVKSAKINFDPVDTTISLQLVLKKPMRVEAFKLPSAEQSSRIVIDLKEQG